MNAKGIAVDVLLGLAVAVVLTSTLGIVAMKDPFDKLHYVTPAALIAPVLVALAVTVHEGWDEITTETWLTVLFVAATSPVLAHATARAARIRQRGDWRQPEDPFDPGVPRK